ncbi:MAG TPA: MFS transporter [Caulobacteraceae bacterium]
MPFRQTLPPQAPPRLRASHIAAVAAGNGLEFYDFLIYATFALYIGRAYFPAHGPVMSLLLSLATFGIGFATRPLGGMVLGRLGDRIGRKPAMLISFALMAVGLLGLAITPSYAQIGLAAPVLVVIFRLIQGFALGGEVGPTTSYLVEAAPPRRRGLIGSMQGASQGVAFLAASGAALALSFALSPHDLERWGWRLAFLFGLIIVPFGLWLRGGLPDIAHAESPLVAEPSRPEAKGAEPYKPAANPDQRPAPSRPLWILVALSVMLLASGTINTYVGSYMTTFAMDTLRLSAHAAFGVGVVNGVCTMLCAPIGGWLSDRFGRRGIMIPAASVSALAILPAFWMLIRHPSPLMLYAAMAATAIPTAMASAAALISITESFPPRMRSFAVGTIYAVAIAVFGGTTQFVVAWLLHATGQPMAPAFYRLAASLMGLTAMICLQESAPAKARAVIPVLAAIVEAA